jgi:hypothetical protein
MVRKGMKGIHDKQELQGLHPRGCQPIFVGRDLGDQARHMTWPVSSQSEEESPPPGEARRA